MVNDLYKNMNKRIFTFLAIIILGGVAIYFAIPKQDEVIPISVSSFEECVSAGYVVMESYPRQCRTPRGEMFTENIGNELEKLDLIRTSTPRPNQIIQSPLTIKGEARGFWFFEADFPIVLVNWDGLIIAEGIAQTKEDWMTEDFVFFEAEIEFEKPTVKNNGYLIFRKDNPSGLPEHDDALEIPVFF